MVAISPDFIDYESAYKDLEEHTKCLYEELRKKDGELKTIKREHGRLIDEAYDRGYCEAYNEEYNGN